MVVEGIVNGVKLKNVKLISVSGYKSFGSGLKNKIVDFYEKVLPQPIWGLTAGVILGSKGTLTADFWNKIKLTKVVDVVVASGINVTFAVSLLMGVLTLFLPRK